MKELRRILLAVLLLLIDQTLVSMDRYSKQQNIENEVRLFQMSQNAFKYRAPYLSAASICIGVGIGAPVPFIVSAALFNVGMLKLNERFPPNIIVEGVNISELITHNYKLKKE